MLVLFVLCLLQGGSCIICTRTYGIGDTGLSVNSFVKLSVMDARAIYIAHHLCSVNMRMLAGQLSSADHHIS